jgi:LPXTG-site transpeptidase (sortase) family protein
MKARRHFIIGLVLLALGLGLLGIVRLRDQAVNQVVALSPASAPKQTSQPVPAKPGTISGSPTRLVIPSINIDIPVIDGYYNSASRAWTLSADKVQFAAMTTLPNNSGGLTFMYGHNNRKVFKQLPNIKPGARASIKTANGHTFTYQFVSSKTVPPTDSSVLSYQGPPVLTLQTCTGFWYQNRSLYTFKLVSA